MIGRLELVAPGSGNGGIVRMPAPTPGATVEPGLEVGEVDAGADRPVDESSPCASTPGCAGVTETAAVAWRLSFAWTDSRKVWSWRTAWSQPWGFPEYEKRVGLQPPHPPLEDHDLDVLHEVGRRASCNGRGRG